MQGTVEAERHWEEELIKVEPIIEELMEEARGRYNWSVSLGRDLLREINSLSSRDPLVITDVLLDYINSPKAREREMAFAILVHPEQGIIGRLASKPKGRDLLEVISETALERAESDKKWPSGWAALFVGKLWANRLFRVSRDTYEDRAEKALRIFGTRAEEQGWKGDLRREIPGLRKLLLFL